MLHHLDLNVSDLTAASAFYGALLGRLGYARAESGPGWEAWRGERGPYLTLVQASSGHVAAGYHRKRIGLNHLAFAAPSREAVSEMAAWLADRGVAMLYGGPMEMGTETTPNFALFFEDPDRLKLEYVYRPAG